MHGQRVGGVPVFGGHMKPSLNRATLQAALVLVGGTLVLVCEAPGIDQLIPGYWLKLLQILGSVLGGSQLLKRVGDYAPSEVTLVEDGRRSVAPPQ
jgi:hypothetical protein